MLVAVRERKENRAVGRGGAGAGGEIKKAEPRARTKRNGQRRTTQPREKANKRKPRRCSIYTPNHDTPGPKNTFTYIGVDGFVKRSLQCLV